MMIILNCLIGTSMSQGMLTILSAENHNHASSMLANTLIDLISQNNGETTIGLAGGSTPLSLIHI